MDKPDVDPLKCQVAGCGKPWSVNMGWRKCSTHAWGKDPDYGLSSVPKVAFKHPPVKPFSEIDDEPF